MKKFILGLIIINALFSCAPPEKVERAVVTGQSDTTKEEVSSTSTAFSLVLDTQNTQKTFLLSEMIKFPQNASVKEGSLQHNNDLLKGNVLNNGVLIDYSLSSNYIEGLLNVNKSSDSYQDKFSVILDIDGKDHLFEVILNVSIIILNDDGGEVIPAEIELEEFFLEKSFLNRVTFIDLRSFVSKTNFQCGEVSFRESNCENCFTNGSFPNIEITPSKLGAWSFNYTATCKDTITKAASSVRGVSSSENQTTNITVADKVLNGSQNHRVNLKELVVAINEDCSPQDKSEITFEIGTCLMCEVSGEGSEIVIIPEANSTDWSLDVYGVCKDGQTKDKGLLSGSTLEQGIKIFAENKVFDGQEVNQEIEINLSELVTSEGNCGEIVFEEINADPEQQCISCDKKGEGSEITITPRIEGSWIYLYKASCENDSNISVTANIMGINTLGSEISGKDYIQRGSSKGNALILPIENLVTFTSEYTCELFIKDSSEMNVGVQKNIGFKVTPIDTGAWEFHYTAECMKDSKTYKVGPYKVSGNARDIPVEAPIKEISVNMKNSQDTGANFIKISEVPGGQFIFEFTLDLSLFEKSSAQTIFTNVIEKSDQFSLLGCDLEQRKVRCRVRSIDAGENISYSIKLKVALDMNQEDEKSELNVTFSAQGKFVGDGSSPGPQE